MDKAMKGEMEMDNNRQKANEKEYDVTVLASFGVMATSQEDANDYILEQFCGGNIEYTSGVETVKIADKVVKYG